VTSVFIFIVCSVSREPDCYSFHSFCDKWKIWHSYSPISTNYLIYRTLCNALSPSNQLCVEIYLRNDVQRPIAVVSVTVTRFPVSFENLVRAQVLKLSRCGWCIIRQTLSHGDIVARSNGKLYPAGVGYISIRDALTGYWQIGIEDQPRWSWIILAY